MAGIDRSTGRLLDGWGHVQQSIAIIITTAFGERVLRRWFGSKANYVLGRNLTPETVVGFFTALIASLEVRELHTGLPREPRFKITNITPGGTPEQLRLGGLTLRINGIYMPRGHLGDTTPQDMRTIVLRQDGRGEFQTVG